MGMCLYVRNLILPVRGNTIEEAKRNLQEALELFFECASSEEVKLDSIIKFI